MGTSLLTRREPAIRRKASFGSGEVSLGGVGNWTGLSASRSRLFAGGLGCGRGRSPTDASSYKMSLKEIFNRRRKGNDSDIP